jgi:vacuolar-type H+-ATPase subunit F/Vma7
MQDTVTGFLLTGIGERNAKGDCNYLIIDESNSIET